MNRRQFLKNVYKTAGIVGLMNVGLTIDQAKCFGDAGIMGDVANVPVPDVGGNCPGGTETFFWNGDHSTSDVTACNNAGGAETGTQSGGTISPTYGQTANGFRRSANDQYITWPVTGDDLISDTVGTLWMSINVQATPLANSVIAESYIDAENKIKFLVISADRIRIEYESNNVAVNHNSDDTFTTQTWTRVGYSWSVTTGTVSITTKIGAGSWKTANTGSASAWTPDDFTIGENASGGGETTDAYIDNVSIFPAYQQADPGV